MREEKSIIEDIRNRIEKKISGFDTENKGN
ncbi:hypothetical protein LCGC14_0638470 [marine sediment metagenome]|uniref:Uncharacterized protein n=1 Tax=marine sediment metagenome TaxID=412755 RepID=A0A0F9RJ96_9ZZZZ